MSSNFFKGLALYFLVCTGLHAQDIDLDDLMSDASETGQEESLLPERMLFTQRAFWGENGLYRKVGIAPKVITAETRARELKVRQNMFKIHQALGLLTAGGMIAQGIVGSKLYNGDFQIKKAHENLALGINIAYGTTALMAFTSPPPMINRRKFDNIKLHKYLSIIHLSGMVATNVLAHKVDDNFNLKKYHRAAAFTTFGAYTLAIASIKFEF